MRRDNFKCRITGRSPATNQNVILEVDHIVPWDKGGETVMENLQTLAKEINIGKSNLDMKELEPPPMGQSLWVTTVIRSMRQREFLKRR